MTQPPAATAVDSSASSWRANPRIYEINTWVWLRQLSQRHGRAITLADVPLAEIDGLAELGFDALWLMGVWQRGTATRLSALNYLDEYRAALPDVTAADVVGSAYAIHAYAVEPRLGGRAGLAAFRRALRRHGIRLILDFVPNHVALDHAWIRQSPQCFIRGTGRDLVEQPAAFFPTDTAEGSAVIAHGRDPHFPAWIDTAQLNLFQPAARRALIDTLIDIGEQCDGLRCDMAMLALNAVFADTWAGRAGAPPTQDFWSEVIPAVRAHHPQLRFFAEAYWDLERELQLQGFDYTYDKRLYDRLLAGDAAAIRAHLAANPAWLRAGLRFIENHDEARAMETLGPDRQRPAAVLICTMPGAALLHQGQLSGRRVKLPVHINRAADEPTHPLLQRFYRRLLRAVECRLFRDGRWQLLEAAPVSPRDDSHAGLIAYTWQLEEQLALVALNFGAGWARARLDLSAYSQLVGRQWLLCDALSRSATRHDGAALAESGLLLESPPQGAQIFRFRPMPADGWPHG